MDPGSNEDEAPDESLRFGGPHFFQEEDYPTAPCYDGKNPGLIEPKCSFCPNEKDKTLNRCLNCMTVWCCSMKCYQKHAQWDYDFCYDVHEKREFTEHTIYSMRETGVFSDDYREVERFYEETDDAPSDELVEYFDARSTLADLYWDTAYTCEIQQMWEEALFQSLKHMQADPECDLSVRVRVPFILLYLNRDDEAYAFVRYWLKAGNGGPSRSYPVEPGCRYLDIHKEIDISEEQDMYLPGLVVLAIIKMRIIALDDAITRSVDLALEQPGAKQIQEVRSVVREMLVGSNIDIPGQREQLNQIFNRMEGEKSIYGGDDDDELSMMDALRQCHHISEICDSSLLYLVVSGMYECPERLRLTLRSSLRCFYRVPCAAYMLENFRNGEADVTRKHKAKDSDSEPAAKR